MSRIILPYESPLDKAIRLRIELRNEGGEQTVRYCKHCKRLGHYPRFWTQLDEVIERGRRQTRVGMQRSLQELQRQLLCDQCGAMTGPLKGQSFIAVYRLVGFDGLVRALNDYYGDRGSN